MIRKTYKVIRAVVTLILILIALTLTVVRAITPVLSSHREDFEKAAINIFHRPVSIGSVRAGMQWFSPILIFDEVTLQQADQKAFLKLHQVSVTIRLFESLLHQQVRPGYLTVDGANLSVTHSSDGVITVEGVESFANGQTTADSRALLEWLLNQDQIVLKHINLTWHSRTKRVLPFRDLEVILVNRGDRHLCRGNFLLEQAQSSSALLRCDLYGKASNLNDWSGRLYLSTRNFVLQQWIPHDWMLANYIKSGTLNGRLWLTLKDSTFEKVQAVVDLNAFSTLFHKGDEQHPFLIQKLKANIAWNRQSQGWHLAADHVHLQMKGHQWPVNSLEWQVENDNGRLVQSAGLRYANLNDLQELLQFYNYPIVRGQMNNLKFSQLPSPHEWKLTTHLYDFGMPAYQSIPAFYGLDANVVLSPQEGLVQVDSHALQILKGEYLRDDLLLQQLAGRFHYAHTPQGWQFDADHIFLKHAKAFLEGRFSYLTTNEDPKGVLDLNMKFAMSDPKGVYRFLPQSYLDDDLGHWLDRALSHEGSLQGTLVHKGALDHFPYLDNSGIFDVDFKLSHIHLHYHDAWPDLFDTEGRLHLHNNTLEAQVHSAKIQHIPISNIHLAIDDMRRMHKTLRIQGKVQSDHKDYLSFIDNSLLVHKLQKLHQLQIKGPIGLSLNLNIPLHQPIPVTYAGQVSVNDGELTLQKWPVSLRKVKGELSFTEDSMSAEKITGFWDDKPFRARISPLHTSMPEAATQLSLTTPLPINRLKSLSSAQWLQSLSGNVMSEIDLTIPHQNNQAVHLRLQSNLVGVTSKLPPPLGKSSQESWPLTVDATLHANRMWLHIMLGNTLHTALILQRSNGSPSANAPWQLFSGEVRFGGIHAHYPTVPGLYVQGAIPELSVDDWYTLMPHHLSRSNSVEVKKFDLQLARLNMAGQHWDNTHVQLDHAHNHWLLQMNAPNAQGQIEVGIAKNAPLYARLSRLHLQNSTGAVSTDLDPTLFPTMHIHIDDFKFGDKKLGELQVDTKPVADGMQIQNLKVSTTSFEAVASGSWRHDANGNTTVLKGEGQTHDLADALALWGLVPAVQAKGGYFGFDFHWLGSPYQAKLPSLNGDLRVQLNEGRITHLDQDTEKKVGLGKLLSLLSLQSLPRHLVMDFHDVSEHGFPFTQFTASFKFKNGQAMTKDAVLEGSMAYAEWNGVIDFAKKNYEINLNVSPHVEVGLPIVATIAGGPIAGAATWIATNMLGHQLHAVTSNHYQLAGDWDKPQLKSLAIPGALKQRQKTIEIADISRKEKSA